MSNLADAYFKTAIADFWTGQYANDSESAANAMVVGLQNFCGGVRLAANPNSSVDQWFQLAIAHFWSAQSKSGLDRDVEMSTGCQLFCAGVQLLYSQSN